MTGETFLDRQQIEFLTRDLRTISVLHPELLRLERKEVSPAGGRAARNPNGYSSTAPIRLGMVGVVNDLHTVLRQWVRNLADDIGTPPPDRDDPRTLAIHLRMHVHQVAQCQWAEDIADEMRSWAGRLSSIAEPPDAKYIGPCQADGKPLCRGLFTGDGRDGECHTCGAEYDPWALQATVMERIDDGLRHQTFTAREVIEIARDRYGIELKRQHIDDMMRRKVDPLIDRGTDITGRKLFHIEDVIDRTRRKKRTA